MKVCSFAQAIACLGLPVMLMACASSLKQDRSVASAAQNTEHIHYLRQAADAGVLFIINDSAFHDAPAQQVGNCAKKEDPIWADNVYNLLEGLDRNPQLYDKIHVIEIIRGDSVGASVKVIEGISKLTVRYAKRMSFEKITPMTQLGCDRSKITNFDRDLEVTNYDWPAKEIILEALVAAPNRAATASMGFGKRFLAYLADHQAVLNLSSDLLFSKDKKSEITPLLSILNRLDAELAMNTTLPEVDFWLKEINIRSKQAKGIVLFKLERNPETSVGVNVGTTGKLSRQINKRADVSYLYLSFNDRDESYPSAGLKDLDSCFFELSKIYRGRDFSSKFESDSGGFLAPGYSCIVGTPTK